MATVHISRETPPSYADLDDVTLKEAATDILDGHTVPAGSTGTVVFVEQPGVSYTVEFAQPSTALVSVRHDQII